MSARSFTSRMFALVFLTAPVLASAGSFVESPFFMPPTCNTRLAISDFKERIGLPQPAEEVRNEPTSDGYFPWSDLMTFWIDPSRDLVISVEKAKDTKRPALDVKFYSLCSGEVIAFGRRSLSDLKGQKRYKGKATELSLSMLMNDKELTEIQTTLSLLKNGSKKRTKLEVSVQEADKTQAPATDIFKARKF